MGRDIVGIPFLGRSSIILLGGGRVLVKLGSPFGGAHPIPSSGTRKSPTVWATTTGWNPPFWGPCWHGRLAGSTLLLSDASPVLDLHHALKSNYEPGLFPNCRAIFILFLSWDLRNRKRPQDTIKAALLGLSRFFARSCCLCGRHICDDY